jgi:hypothetical protein
MSTNLHNVYEARPAMLAELSINSEIGVAAAIEARRIAEKYGKDFLCCEDLVSIMGVGTNNIRQLLNSDDFPTITVGNRKVVSAIAFTLWSLKHNASFG